MRGPALACGATGLGMSDGMQLLGSPAPWRFHSGFAHWIVPYRVLPSPSCATLCSPAPFHHGACGGGGDGGGHMRNTAICGRASEGERASDRPFTATAAAATAFHRWREGRGEGRMTSGHAACARSRSQRRSQVGVRGESHLLDIQDPHHLQMQYSMIRTLQQEGLPMMYKFFFDVIGNHRTNEVTLPYIPPLYIMSCSFVACT